MLAHERETTVRKVDFGPVQLSTGQVPCPIALVLYLWHFVVVQLAKISPVISGH